MYLEENTDARLIDVRIEDCEALVEHCCASGRGGGGMFMEQSSTLRAERVHMARCRALLTGGSALALRRHHHLDRQHLLGLHRRLYNHLNL